jgi:hypothetical protein
MSWRDAPAVESWKLAPVVEDGAKEVPQTQPRGEPPAWAAEYPNLYKAAVTTRQMAGPTLEMLGGLGGAAVGTVGATPGLGTLAGAGAGYAGAKQALRLADQYLGLEPRLTPQDAIARATKDIAEGATLEAGGRVIAPVVAPVANFLMSGAATGAGKLADIRQLPNQLAAKTARESFGGPTEVAAARAALQAPEAAGLTAQQALARGGVVAPSAQATMARAIERGGALGTKAPVDTRAAIEAAQESARKATIQNITPDLQEAINARRAASAPLYEAADRAVVPIDAELSAVLARMPEGTLAQAANIAKMEGRPFIMGKTTPAQKVETGILTAAGTPVTREVPAQTAEITGESLHYIKRALGDIAYGAPSTQAGRDAQLAARTLLDDYIKVFESKVPEYGQARTTFSTLSAPVNQAQVLKEMVSVLEKPGGGERIGPFLNVLGRGEQAMLKRAGGRGAPRFEALSEVLTPEQISTVRDVARQLEAEMSIGQQVTAGRQRASELIKDELPNYRIPNVFNVFVTSANRVLDTLGTRVGKKTVEKMAEASLSAKSFDDLLNTLPAQERVKVLKAINDPDTWKPAIRAATPKAMVGLGSTITPTNNLAPESAPENALAR